jgi:hypothetical protein
VTDGTNTLAYYNSVSITAVKSFVEEAFRPKILILKRKKFELFSWSVVLAGKWYKNFFYQNTYILNKLVRLIKANLATLV